MVSTQKLTLSPVAEELSVSEEPTTQRRESIHLAEEKLHVQLERLQELKTALLAQEALPRQPISEVAKKLIIETNPKDDLLIFPPKVSPYINANRSQAKSGLFSCFKKWCPNKTIVYP